MKLGIMQPYFFPYIGYWQLLNAVDKYIIYDDVNFIKGGWINRNRILNNGKEQFINVQMSGASSFKHINEIEVQNNGIMIEKMKKTIWNAYHKSPEFDNVYPILCDVFECGKNNLAEYLTYSIRQVCTYLGIETELCLSSQLEKNDMLHGENKVIDICNRMKADTYYNAIGGKELYNKENFEKHQVNLKFLKAKLVSYNHFDGEFHPGLSIIDVMMFNSKKQISEMLLEYELEEN